MAHRPVFIPVMDKPEFVQELSFSFTWHPGFAVSQKKKNIIALHEAAAQEGLTPLLEISTKSEEELGRRLSAFNLKIQVAAQKQIPLECAFQGGKVFRDGGPYLDLYDAHPKAAKRDDRLRNSGPLKAFTFQGETFPLEPKTLFYDYIYTKSVATLQIDPAELTKYKGFTDIEFNPKRSINCQARAIATYVALYRRGLLEKALESSVSFKSCITD